MRPYKLLRLLLPLLLASLACQTIQRLGQPNLSGAWKGTYDDESVVMDFDTSGDVWIYVGDDSSHGEYEADLQVEPHHLDITLDNGDTIATIFEFVDRNTIRMENNSPNEARPTGFDDFIELSQ